MSNHTHINWIFNLLKELQDDDDHKHDLDYSPDSSEKSHDPTFEIERQLMAHFSVHPKIYGNSKTQPTMCLVYYVIASYSNRWGCLHARRKDPHKTYNTPRFGHCNKMATWW